MSDPEGTLEVLKSLVVLRRALRTGLAKNDGEPKLSVAQVQAVLHLAQNGPMTMGTLADQLGVSYPAATDLVDRLVAAGRVERVADQLDRRKVQVQLTPATRAIAEGALAARRQKVADVLNQLSGSERVGFVRGLQLLADALATGVGVWLTSPSLTALEAALASGFP